jgi:uncharacterized BrkB/YihY/UPF0761 family membrane protein
MRMKEVINFIRQVFSEWSEDKAPRLAAALAYYTIFSIPPLLLAIIGICGLVLWPGGGSKGDFGSNRPPSQPGYSRGDRQNP